MSLSYKLLSAILLLGCFALASPLSAQDEEVEKRLRKIWILDLKHQKPKRFEFTFENIVVRKGYIGRKIKKLTSPRDVAKSEVYWYVIYTLTTHEKEPVRAFVDVVAESRGKGAERMPKNDLYPPRPRRSVKYHDGYYPLVKKAIELKHKRRFWGQNDLTMSTSNAPRERSLPTKLNLPVLGGVDTKRSAILNLKDGNKLRGKIGLINNDIIQLVEFEGNWNMIPFVRHAIKNQSKIRQAIITKKTGEQISCKIVDFARDEVIYDNYNQKGHLDLGLIKSIKLVVPRSKVNSISYECIAIFKQWDLHMDRLKITWKGLTNSILFDVGRKSPPDMFNANVLLNQIRAQREADKLEKLARRAKANGQILLHEDLTKLVKTYRNMRRHDRILRQSVLEVVYERPGDEFYVTLDKMTFISRRWKTYASVIKMDLPGRERED